ncbi:hypothetical protein [Alkaliphilus transvaalensis]|uniref:hypothetical protein n=1 Tax=Alkaliphilus transvaalensis TaxID=114628 RepID=UPI00047E81E1|nr:hypothetical protein [Alkaliphilus transvaalensis]
MLNKLLRWEFKATARLLIPLYLTLLLFSLINRIINPFNLIQTSNNFSLQIFISYITIVAYFSLVVGTVAMTLVIMIQRFYKSLLGDEGYLMFTLPTTTWKHIISKLLVAVVWVIGSMVTTITSIIIISGADNIGQQLIELINGVKEILGVAGIFTLPFMMLLMITTAVLMIYAAISLGHMFSRHKLIASFAMYGVLYLFSQILIVISIVIFSNSFFATLINSTETTPDIFRKLSIFYIIFATLLSTVYFTLTNTLLTKKLNLE